MPSALSHAHSSVIAWLALVELVEALAKRFSRCTEPHIPCRQLQAESLSGYAFQFFTAAHAVSAVVHPQVQSGSGHKLSARGQGRLPSTHIWKLQLRAQSQNFQVANRELPMDTLVYLSEASWL